MRFPYLLSASLLIVSCSLRAAENPMDQFQMPKVQEPKIPDRTVKVTDFGALADGKTLNTEAIAKAIAALVKDGGGRLIVPPGIWLTGPIEMKSRIDLHLEEGALVLFTREIQKYPVHVWNLNGELKTNRVSPIWGENLEDVAITGRGVVDANGGAWRPVKKSKMTQRQWRNLLSSGGVTQTNRNDEIWWPSAETRELDSRLDHRPNLLKLFKCRRLLFEGVTFQNSPNWNLNPTMCEDVTIRNITVRNPWYSQNGDGLDLEHCRNVIVRDSRFDVGDDAICLKSGLNAAGRRIAVPTENVLIENCVVYHGHGGVTIGSEMSSGVRNVRVNNCTFIGTDLGLRFKSTRGRGGVVEKIYISNVRMTDILTDAIGFNMYYGGQSPTEAEDGGAAQNKSTGVNEGTPQFRDIYIQDVVCRGARTAVALQGLPEMPIRGIHLRNVSITSERGIVCTDAQDITLDNVEIRNSHGPAVSLASSRDIRINGLSYTPGVESIIKATGTNNAGIIIKNTDLKSAKQDFSLTDGASREAFKTE